MSKKLSKKSYKFISFFLILLSALLTTIVIDTTLVNHSLTRETYHLNEKNSLNEFNIANLTLELDLKDNEINILKNKQSNLYEMIDFYSNTETNYINRFEYMADIYFKERENTNTLNYQLMLCERGILK